MTSTNKRDGGEVLPSDTPREAARAREWCEMYLAEKARAERLAEALRVKAAKWDRIGDEHGLRQFTGNDHKLFANELRALLRDQEPPQ